MNELIVLMRAAWLALLIDVAEWRRKQWGKRRQRAANKRFEWQERMDALDMRLKQLLLRGE
jgi:hypothetical protein